MLAFVTTAKTSLETKRSRRKSLSPKHRRTCDLNNTVGIRFIRNACYQVFLIMPKVCSIPKCKRLTDDKFKACQHCRDMKKKSDRKRKEKAAKATARDGYKYCRNCYREFALSHFQSSHSRRKTLTSRCASCRAISSKSRTSKNSKRGKCKQVWFDWKKEKSCELCGYKGDNIEADHRVGQKIYSCGSYAWWANHGGIPALEAELEKCRPLCTFCHRLVSQQERGVLKQKSIIKKKAYVHAIKLRIGECQVCKRKLKKEEECCAFDFDHIDAKLKQSRIARMVSSYSLKRFFQCIDLEVSKCRLLCANCHADHTRKQRREKTLIVQELAINYSEKKIKTKKIHRLL